MLEVICTPAATWRVTGCKASCSASGNRVRSSRHIYDNNTRPPPPPPPLTDYPGLPVSYKSSDENALFKLSRNSEYKVWKTKLKWKLVSHSIIEFVRERLAESLPLDICIRQQWDALAKTIVSNYLSHNIRGIVIDNCETAFNMFKDSDELIHNKSITSGLDTLRCLVNLKYNRRFITFITFITEIQW